MHLYMLWLSLVGGIGPVAIKKLLARFTDPFAVYRADYEELLKVSGIGKAAAASLVQSRSLQAAETILTRCEKQHINLLTCLDAAYPDHLKNAAHAPPLLYYLGAEPRRCGVAIVGSRKCSAYGKEVACDAAASLANVNVPVLSGMAAGIDGYAHTACLKAGGYTIAFPGGGVDIVYPSEHRVLQQEIAATGTIVSPFPPGTPAHAARFARRNYLMAAWAETIVIVEAGHKSGALLTADYGLHLGKRVMAVPGSIYSRQSIGTNLLLTQGAEPYLSPAQLLENSSSKPGSSDMGGVLEDARHQPESDNHRRQNSAAPKEGSRSDTAKPPGLPREMSALEAKILQILHDAPLSMDRLAHYFKGERADFFEALAMLEIEGLLERLPGGMVGRCNKC